MKDRKNKRKLIRLSSLLLLISLIVFFVWFFSPSQDYFAEIESYDKAEMAFRGRPEVIIPDRTCVDLIDQYLIIRTGRSNHNAPIGYDFCGAGIKQRQYMSFGFYCKKQKSTINDADDVALETQYYKGTKLVIFEGQIEEDSREKDVVQVKFCLGSYFYMFTVDRNYDTLQDARGETSDKFGALRAAILPYVYHAIDEYDKRPIR